MKARDYVIFGSNASTTLGIGAEDKIVWEYNANNFFEVEANAAMELIELGMLVDYFAERTKINNKDLQEWIPAGFITAGASIAPNLTELPWQRRPSFDQILAPITPDGGPKLSPTFKLPSGDRMTIRKINSPTGATTASASVSSAVGIVRKYVAQDAGDQNSVEQFAKTFGGLESNGQLWHEVGSISGAAANGWWDIVVLTLLKSELYAFNSFGVYVPAGVDAGEYDKSRIQIDDQIEYNRYPGSQYTGYNDSLRGLGNIAPFNDGHYYPNATLTDSQATWVVPRSLIFDKPLVVKKTTNKTLRLQGFGSAALAATNVPLYGRLRGIRYKI